MKIIVGLGNPGRQYARTRHNAGYLVVDRLRRDCAELRRHNRVRFAAWEVDIAGERTVLLRSRTFMNESGVAVSAALASFRRKAEDLLVVHDDLDIPVGTIKVTGSRGAGGHNGVRSVAAMIGTTDFHRVRVGIGRPSGGVEGIDYVLSPFSPEEREAVEQAVGRAAAACITLVTEGPAKAMSLFNAAPAAQ